MDYALEGVKGLGPARRKALAAAGITDFSRLLMYFPQKYTDYSVTKRIGDCVPGEDAVLDVRIYGRPSQARVNGKTITRAVLYDDTGRLNAAWFSQPWMYGILSGADTLTVYGRVDRKNGYLQLTAPRIVSEKCLTPVYKPIEGVPAKLLRELLRTALDTQSGQEETLPESFIDEYALMPRREALEQIHFPKERADLERALYRFSFENTLYFMLAALSVRGSESGEAGIDIDAADAARFADFLPYPLTGAQKRVLSEIIADIKAPRAMARLVQGDVGCGKTAVAFGAIYAVAQAGMQSAMMAPTEILASQHYQSALETLGRLGVNCALLTGSTPASKRREILCGLESGEVQAVFGTHALISPYVKYNSLGLVVTDEQHRFGVRQRTRLGEKGDKPNVLVMSATPIPRTLALILYGDLDISVIDELPPGRKAVKTRIVPESKREDMYRFIASETAKGRQAYFVCPLVENSESLDAESAQNLYESLKSSSLGDLPIALVHGRTPAAEKEALLTGFKRGEIKILVSTTVIEVGINVPAATVMVIENAERFGLAQLHQLRGRVGRGTDEAWCFLMAQTAEKLKILTQTNDGFAIAQKDMELRGPGDMFGTRQSGALAGLDAHTAADTQLIARVHALARSIYESGSPDARALKEKAENWLRARADTALSPN